MPFDRQPTLEGGLVLLRPLASGDFPALSAAASDPLIWQQHPATDRHRPEIFKKFFDDALVSGGALAAIDRSSGRIVGSSRFHGYSEERSEIEIGWTFLARSHWGGAFNGEMKRLMIDHAFRFVDRVVFLVAPGNVRSRKALAKIGAVEIGTRNDDAGNPSLLFEIRRPNPLRLR